MPGDGLVANRWGGVRSGPVLEQQRVQVWVDDAPGADRVLHDVVEAVDACQVFHLERVPVFGASVAKLAPEESEHDLQLVAADVTINGSRKGVVQLGQRRSISV